MTRRILTAAILILFVLASLLLLPLPAFLMVLDIFLLLALREFANLAAATGSRLYLSSYALALMAPWIVNYLPEMIGPASMCAILITLIWGIVSSRGRKETFPSVSGNLLALCYLGLPFSLIATFHPTSHPSLGGSGRPYELIFVILVVGLSDAAALFTGKAIGRHKITPSISPNKTLEGYLAALIFPVLAATAVGGYFVSGSTLPRLALTGLTIAAAGVLGDLFESILKRGAGIKDTSTLIPGHGGILDRVDSLLFAVPAYYLLPLLLA